MLLVTKVKWFLEHGPMMRHLPRQPLVAWEPSNFNYTLWGSSTCLRHHRLLGALPLLGPFWWANLSFSESSVCKCLSHWGCFSCIFGRLWADLAEDDTFLLDSSGCYLEYIKDVRILRIKLSSMVNSLWKLQQMYDESERRWIHVQHILWSQMTLHLESIPK